MRPKTSLRLPEIFRAAALRAASLPWEKHTFGWIARGLATQQAILDHRADPSPTRGRQYQHQRDAESTISRVYSTDAKQK